MLTLDRVTHQYDGSDFELGPISLELGNERITALIGASGSGKSTLVELLAGYLTTASGRISRDGKNITNDPIGSRSIATFHQNSSLLPHLTVAQNVMLKKPNDEEEKKLLDLAKSLDIHTLLTRKGGEVSGGQAARALLARALISDARTLILDEPTNSLDMFSCELVEKAIIQSADQRERDILLVSHDRGFVSRVADQIIVMEDGEVISVASSTSTYSTPASPNVARIVGGFEFARADLHSKKVVAIPRARLAILDEQAPSEFSGYTATARVLTSRITLGAGSENQVEMIYPDGDRKTLTMFHHKPLDKDEIVTIRVSIPSSNSFGANNEIQ